MTIRVINFELLVSFLDGSDYWLVLHNFYKFIMSSAVELSEQTIVNEVDSPILRSIRTTEIILSQNLRWYKYSMDLDR